MPFTPPQFNVLADIWACGNKPSAGDPDFENVSVQLYINPRVPWSEDTTFTIIFNSPGIFVRMPESASVAWQACTILEIPAESGRYYFARWKDIMHLGFPNQYRVILVAQCDADGKFIQRDVCPPPAPTGAMQANITAVMAGLGHKGTPSAHTGEGAMGFAIAAGCVGNGIHA